MRGLCIGLLLLFATANIKAQSSFSGSVKDSATNESLISAYIKLTQLPDSITYAQVTDLNGLFSFNLKSEAEYLVEISYLGYKTYSKTIYIDNKKPFLLNVKLAIDNKKLKEISIETEAIAVQQKGDTTEYNAKSYKVNPDANTSDLIKKMPGVIVENGTVQAQGEEVKKVLVDGKEFFSNDPNVALNTLPANIIDKIQVYDQLSDQAQFTGFDDGNSVKTINIITKPDRKNGTFGKAYLGYGSDQRYEAGANYNYFNNDQRITVLGLANNINQTNFSTNDLTGIISNNSSNKKRRRGPGQRDNFDPNGDPSDFLIGDQSGITNAQSFGVNYSDIIGKKLTLNASYFFNATQNEQLTNSNTQYYSTEGNGLLYSELDSTNTDNYNHRVNLRLNYKINDKNSIIFTPSFNTQNTQTISTLLANNSLDNVLIADQLTNNDLQSIAYNSNGNLLFKHAFSKRGRTISLNMKGDYSNNTSETNYLSTGLASSNEYNNIYGDAENNSNSLEFRTIYTEPISKIAMLQVGAKSQWTQSTAKDFSYAFDSINDAYNIVIDDYSNSTKTEYLKNTIEGGLRFRGKKMMGLVNIEAQNAELLTNQSYPSTSNYDINFTNILPMAMFRYKGDNNKNISLFYRSFTNMPTISQLQEVIDYSNPLQISIGNSSLKQEYRQLLGMRFSKLNSSTQKNFFVFAMISNTQNYIGSANYIAEESEIIQDGILLSPGMQLSTKQNLDNYWNGKAAITYAFPIKKLQSNLNLNTNFTYSSVPSLLNDIVNRTDNYGFSEGISLHSNISDKVDFSIGYTANINLANNSIETSTSNNYFYHQAIGKLTLLLPKNWVVGTDITYYAYTGLQESFNQDFTLVNAKLGKKFLKDQKGELSIKAFDLLKQNNSLSRSVSESYVYDQETVVLQRYFLLSFAYTFSKFKS